MKIAICDDQPKFLVQAMATIKNIHKSLDLIIDEFTSGPALLARLEDVNYDLIILDIEMPDMNGIQVARNIRKLAKDTEIVFLTSHIEYALEGYEVNALRYLTKPIQEKKIEEILLYLLDQKRKAKKILLQTKTDVFSIHISDICYFESQNHDIRVVTKTNEYVVRGKLSDYETECKNLGFFRIHRGYLIHLGSVTRIKDGMAYMTNGDFLPISRGKEKSTKEALHLYIQEVAL